MSGPEVLPAIAGALREFWQDRRALVMTPRLTGITSSYVTALARYGAEVSAAVSGAEPALGSPSVPRLWICADHGVAAERKDAFDRWLHDPGPAFASWLDRVDPQRSLTVFPNSQATVSTLCGRTVHGWRRPEWALWEDKVRVEELWREIGAPSPRHVIGDVDDSSVRSALADLDRGLGVVVAGDSTSEIMGAGRGLRWVRTTAGLETVLDDLRETVDRVRVAEFLPGIPWSVIGIVLRDGVAVFEPFEIVTLCDVTKGRLVLCGSSNRWRPDPESAERIREFARRTGEYLAVNAGFRGVFSADGILNENGFFATEVNPRMSGGLGLERVRPELSEVLIHRAAVEQLPGIYDMDPEALEAEVRGVVRQSPSHKFSGPLDGLVRRITATAARHGVTHQLPDLSGEFVPVGSLLPDGVIAPFVAEFAAKLGLESMTTCADAVAVIQNGLI
ncbi:hypothetical protein GXW83_24025 [Streptacidiphilus sp. PB12-B1b]|uniref:hypothetical protein n=1 Tax=Streptacidiphilus sp. PB12-B1b TaxID=2705012 RepID=UPI0015F9ADDD|nr:hypothetical protein [Streptacidiphilus sp. PB12-B1b]QMU78317.1 hypothetical protein GXW83_24025 [Streptacidiphilus sp. PB12-B1b]